jgi:hypothetical protein
MHFRLSVLDMSQVWNGGLFMLQIKLSCCLILFCPGPVGKIRDERDHKR